ncbi:MAG: NFACT RNA binding domain-containing protein [Nanoarchaeota archaeon]|nr:NFACT RNA binding domain-containing protein [Nanoarchaeota archaeon]
MKEMDYSSYRWFFTSKNNLVFGGKNEQQNEELVKKFIGKGNMILHTEEPGSPFCIFAEDKIIDKKEIQEAAIFCASFSQQWKLHKKMAEVNIFYGLDVTKKRNMPVGTFGVVDFKTIKVELKLIIMMQKNLKSQLKIRAVPLDCYHEKVIEEFNNKYEKKIEKKERKIPKIILTPGKMEKNKTALLIKDRFKEYGLDLNLEDILQAIPAGGFNIT